MSIVCSSTSPTHPGAFTFWVGSYHPNPMGAGVDGEIYVHEPSGNEPHTTFSAWCSLQDCPTLPCAETVKGIDGTADINAIRDEMEKAGHCTAVQNAAGDPLMYDDSVLSCYEANVAMDPQRFGTAVTSGTGTNAPGANVRQSINCNGIMAVSMSAYEYNVPVHQRDIRTMFGVFVSGVKAGTYKTWTVNTDDNLDPSPKSAQQTPCSMSETNPYFFDISVADGLTDCIVPPPANANAVATSLQFCAPANGRRIFSGFVCSVVCDIGFVRIGTLICDNGKWTPYKCSDQPVCKFPGEDNNNLMIPGKNDTPSVQFINAVWDGEPGPPVDPGCGVLTESGTACNYTCNLDTSPYCTPTRTTALGAEKLAFPLRGEIICGADSNWYPGLNFCGCQEQPCFTPTMTLSLTQTFTRSLSLSQTLSITSSRSISLSLTLTPTATPLPLCVFLDPLASVFCRENMVHPFFPWFLLLLLCCCCICLLFACLSKKKLPPDEPMDEPDEPAIVDADEIHVGVKKVDPPPLPPPVEEVDITVSKLPPPAEPEVEIGVHPAPESDVNIGVHKVPSTDLGVMVSVNRMNDTATSSLVCQFF